ncbi:MAG TPA: divergent polysaccharide deacetylase family protein, partial [Acetobacteraceae bacterium]|nr:divergent polysaccharide deacetylase family protein [Acetobacteraceae bacterium]
MILPRRRFVTGAIAAAALIPGLPAYSQSMLIELDPSQVAPVAPPAPADVPPPWRRNAVAAPALDGRPAITLVIDDMGVMHPYTAQAMALPGPLTLAWFPFARDLPAKVAAAGVRGHEAMLHMPMQAYTDSIAQTGPDPLRIDLPPDVNRARLRDAIAAVPDIVGVNNHMG